MPEYTVKDTGVAVNHAPFGADKGQYLDLALSTKTMKTIYFPDRNPDNRKCRFCGIQGAEKWDGGFQFYTNSKDGRMIAIKGPQYCCVKCDYGNNWFDLDEEDYLLGP